MNFQTNGGQKIALTLIQSSHILIELLFTGIASIAYKINGKQSK